MSNEPAADRLAALTDHDRERFSATDKPLPDLDDLDSTGWADATVRCRCDAAITAWHARADARRLARVYGDAQGRVPACPACVDARDGRDDTIDTVPLAIKHYRGASSVDASGVRLEREAMRE